MLGARPLDHGRFRRRRGAHVRRGHPAAGPAPDQRREVDAEILRELAHRRRGQHTRGRNFGAGFVAGFGFVGRQLEQDRADGEDIADVAAERGDHTSPRDGQLHLGFVGLHDGDDLVARTRSPTATSHRTISASAIPSPRSGRR